MELTVITALLGCVVGVATFFIGRMTAAKQEGTKDGTLLTEIGYIKRQSDEIATGQKEASKNFYALSERVTRIEESSKQAHKRIDKIEGKA